MAEIKQTPTIAPVLPTSTRNGIRQDRPRPVQERQECDPQQPKRQGPDEHQVDEYA